MERTREIFTPDQAADYLQINRETVYRYIKTGRLVASKLGRSYRIPRRSLDLLLWSTRTQPALPLREFTTEEVVQFIRDDQMDQDTRTIADRFLESVERKGRRSSEPATSTPSVP